MAKRYKIGKFEFDTYDEYVRGMTDVKKIHNITHSVDIYDPDTALRLYQNIRAKKIEFYSAIGRQFFLDIADIVAENTQNIMEEQEEPQEPQKPDYSRQILGGVCLVAAIACFAWYFWSDYTNRRGNQVNEYLKELRDSPQTTVEMVSNDTFFLEDAPELAAATDAGYNDDTAAGSQAVVLQEFQPILQQNSNFAGWITIDDTKIDYPIVLTRDGSDYYLHHNFNGEEDINGTLFMDARTDLTNRSTNIIIYGHNMKSGQMFGDLKKFLSEDFFCRIIVWNLIQYTRKVFMRSMRSAWQRCITVTKRHIVTIILYRRIHRKSLMRLYRMWSSFPFLRGRKFRYSATNC